MRPKIVITGGTRGLGLCLARGFLERGADIFIIGTTQASVDRALKELGKVSASGEAGKIAGGPGIIAGSPGDIGRPEDLERLAKEALAALGGIDHWINNAGINQLAGRVLDLPTEEYLRIVRTDLLGPLYAARAARPALEASGGYIWFMEGHGSDGRIIDGLSLYGTSKRALAYLWRALAVESKGGGLRIGALSPGIMATDFILKDRETMDEEEWRKKAKLYNILADKPETVASFLVPRILKATRNGERIAWLTTGKILGRFLSAPLHHRHIVD